jgi:hypothetical protein
VTRRRGEPGRLRRAALTLFFGSVALNALLGVVALAGGDFGETERRLLATSLCVTGALLLGLLCLPAWERRLLGLVPAVSAASGAVGFSLVIGSIWSSRESDTLGKLLGTLLLVAAAGALSSLLALASLPPHQAAVVPTAHALAALGAAGGLLAIWFEIDSSGFARGLGVVAVLLAALVVTIPVLHRLARAAVTPPADGIPAVGFCPYCGAHALTGRDGVAACSDCHRRFVIHADV